MARTVKTVKATGGDYTTLAAALAAVPNITGIAPDTVNGKPIAYEIQCFASAANDSTVPLVSYGTLDSGHWLLISCPPGEGHAGYWDTSRYYVETTLASSYGILLGKDYVMVDGLQINAIGASSLTMWISNHAIVLNTLLKGVHRPIHITGGTVDFNNVAVLSAGGYAQQAAAGVVATFENCTFAGNASYGYVNNGGSVTMKNCYAGGNGNLDFLGTITFVGCACEDNIVASGLTPNVVFTTAANFISITPGATEYLRPRTAGALDGTGADLSADANWWLGAVDITGGTRTVWDLGAYEAEALIEGSTYQYAVPNADVTDGGWLNELGTNANLHMSVDDLTTDDSTYIQSSASPVFDQCIVGLSAIKVPVAGEVLMRVRVKLV